MLERAGDEEPPAQSLVLVGGRRKWVGKFWIGTGFDLEVCVMVSIMHFG
jgi:hypothetical protein